MIEDGFKKWDQKQGQPKATVFDFEDGQGPVQLNAGRVHAQTQLYKEIGGSC